METTLLTDSFLRAWYPQRYPTPPHLCQSDAVKYFRCRKGLLPLSSFWRKALDKSFDRKDDNGVFAITSGSTIKCVTVVTAQAACPAAAYAFEYAATAFSFQQPPMLVRVRRILFGRIPHRPACNETHQTVWIPHFSRYGQNVEQSLDFNSRSFEEIQQIL